MRLYQHERKLDKNKLKKNRRVYYMKNIYLQHFILFYSHSKIKKKKNTQKSYFVFSWTEYFGLA